MLTVDDQAVFRAAARTVVNATPGFQPVGEAASGPEGLELAGRLHPDLVLMDVVMPGMDGTEAARRLGAASPGVVVVLMSAFDDPLPDELRDGPGSRPFLHKEDLRPRTLRSLWDRHRPQASAETAVVD